MITNLYIDGFNLYYGCVKGTPYKWLDIGRLCTLLLPRNKIHRIRYFTALVTPRSPDLQQTQRQLTYLRALQTLPNLSIHRGHFLSHAVRLPLASPTPRGPKTEEVIVTSEKGSDVNLATCLLTDGFDGDYEVAVIVSNDSDLLLPVKYIQNRLRRPVGILNPHLAHPSRDLAATASFVKPIRPWALAASQFPNTMTDANGTITKPSCW